MFQTKFVEKIKTYLFSINFFLKNLAVYEIMWKSVIDPYRSQITIFLMRLACWISKATDIHSEYVLIIVFHLQKWFRERVSILRYAYTASLFPILSNPTQTNHSIIVTQASSQIN